jgi:hypothetical protein
VKNILILFLAAMIVIAIACIIVGNQQVWPATGLVHNIQSATTPAILESPPPPETPAIASEPEIQTIQTRTVPFIQPQKIATQNPSPLPPVKRKAPVQDPTARVALSFVGADPAAEAYWMSAISDPNLPDQEREDLMEDLNEDGLSDPKHPGPEDLPLILNRLELIEEIAPTADPFMQEHLGEAYKDLNNMLAGKTIQ